MDNNTQYNKIVEDRIKVANTVDNWRKIGNSDEIQNKAKTTSTRL